MRKQKGITLIALIVVIIIMVIISAAAISYVLNDKIILQSQEASRTASRDAILEQIQLDVTEKRLENNGKISDEELDEILAKYGTVEGKILTTFKGRT